jgi:hypothetical protein
MAAELPGSPGATDEQAETRARRLRDRISDIFCDLAAAIHDARDLADPTRNQLDETYRMALAALFRLLAIAYAEDAGLLPVEDPRYERHSLNRLVHELHDADEFDPDSTDYWNRVRILANAVHDGRPEWGLPAYGGWLFASDPDRSSAGVALARVDPADDRFGPLVRDLFVGADGVVVDLNSLDVRTFGAVYEGLLDAELSVADRPLAVNSGGRYVSAESTDDVAVEAGEAYLHGRSGEREATGSYYTDAPFVAHLLDHALDPAIEDHLDRLDAMDDAEAATAFLDFRVADVAMGSGAFLLAAADRVADRLSAYLDERPLAGVEATLDSLRERATRAFEPRGEPPDIGRDRLLRRLVATRCVRGVDRNPLAVELTRLSLWLHAFVPGLPIDDLDDAFVTGDSLSGIGTFAEAEEILAAAAPERATATATALREDLDARPERMQATFDVLAAARVDEIDPTVVLDDGPPSHAHDRAGEVLGPVDPVHFPVAFPDAFARENPGFDAVVGNPPWEESMLDEDAFWTRYAPGLQREESHGGTKAERIEHLRAECPDLAARYEREKAARSVRRAVLTSGPYPGMGTGDPDAYKAFCWRNWALARDGGYVGAVLPRGAFLGAGSAAFRREILESGDVTDLTFLKNRDRWVFEGVGPRYTAGLLACRKAEPSDDASLPIRGPFADPESFAEGVAAEPHRFPVAEARRWTGTTLFPMLPADPRSVGVFERMARHPRLDRDDPDSWRARPYRELDETTDRTADDGTTLVHTTDVPPGEGFWPVLDGASLNPPDEPGWVMDTGARFGWADPDVLLAHLQAVRENSYRYAGQRSAFAEFSEEWVRDPDTLACLRPRVAFRHVTQRTNRRTICASLVPPETFLTNAAPYFLWPEGDERDEAYLLGVLNAIPFDWYARLFVEANVNYHILNSLRVPRPGRESALRRRVEEIAGRLAARDERYAGWADTVGVEWGSLGGCEEMELVRELDAVVAHLFGLSREDLAVVFETFHRNWDHEERLEDVLERFESWDE